ncbi:MAG TPA: hypothetical protein VEO53_13490 [Candidatus Binatia bacterium]|nr:hypothetical protein [Candidatus Binatia bacterium]
MTPLTPSDPPACRKRLRAEFEPLGTFLRSGRTVLLDVAARRAIHGVRQDELAILGLG